MPHLKRVLPAFLLMMILLILIAPSAFAQEPSPTYIYYERSTGFASQIGDVVMVNYEDALNDPTGLYEALRDALRASLADSRSVWIEVTLAVDGGSAETVIIDYSKALADDLTYSEVVAMIEGGSTGYEDYLTARPEPLVEMYYDGGIKYRSPSVLAPLTFPAWLDAIDGDNLYKAVFEEFSSSWLVQVRIIEGELPANGNLSTLKVRVKYLDGDTARYVNAKAVPGTGNTDWLAVIPAESDTPAYTLSPGDVEVMVGLSWYNQ